MAEVIDGPPPDTHPTLVQKDGTERGVTADRRISRIAPPGDTTSTDKPVPDVGRLFLDLAL